MVAGDTARGSRDARNVPMARVFLRPLATPLPLGFLALAAATTVFAVVQLD